MTDSGLDLTTYRALLEQQRDELQSEIDQLQVESASVNQEESYGVKNHPAEDATDMFLRGRNQAVSGDLYRELTDVERALRRIEAGTYGLCEVCGDPINAERLQARPAATFCIRHQRERERAEHVAE